MKHRARFSYIGLPSTYELLTTLKQTGHPHYATEVKSNRFYLNKRNMSLVWTTGQQTLRCVGETDDLSS